MMAAGHGGPGMPPIALLDQYAPRAGAEPGGAFRTNFPLDYGSPLGYTKWLIITVARASSGATGRARRREPAPPPQRPPGDEDGITDTSYRAS